MDVLIAWFFTALLATLQTAVLSQVHLLQGMGDLVLVVLLLWSTQAPPRATWLWTLSAGLLLGWLSALPWPAFLIAYVLCVALARLLRRWLWTLPFLASLLSVFTGTFLSLGIQWLTLQLQGISLPLPTAFNQIMLPSLLLNLGLTVLLYGWVHDLAAWLYPKTLEV